MAKEVKAEFATEYVKTLEDLTKMVNSLAAAMTNVTNKLSDSSKRYTTIGKNLEKELKNNAAFFYNELDAAIEESFDKLDEKVLKTIQKKNNDYVKVMLEQLKKQESDQQKILQSHRTAVNRMITDSYNSYLDSMEKVLRRRKEALEVRRESNVLLQPGKAIDRMIEKGMASIGTGLFGGLSKGAGVIPGIGKFLKEPFDILKAQSQQALDVMEIEKTQRQQHAQLSKEYEKRGGGVKSKAEFTASTLSALGIDKSFEALSTTSNETIAKAVAMNEGILKAKRDVIADELLPAVSKLINEELPQLISAAGIKAPGAKEMGGLAESLTGQYKAAGLVSPEDFDIFRQGIIKQLSGMGLSGLEQVGQDVKGQIAAGQYFPKVTEEVSVRDLAVAVNTMSKIASGETVLPTSSIDTNKKLDAIFQVASDIRDVYVNANSEEAHYRESFKQTPGASGSMKQAIKEKAKVAAEGEAAGGGEGGGGMGLLETIATFTGLKGIGKYGGKLLGAGKGLLGRGVGLSRLGLGLGMGGLSAVGGLATGGVAGGGFLSGLGMLGTGATAGAATIAVPLAAAAGTGLLIREDIRRVEEKYEEQRKTQEKESKSEAMASTLRERKIAKGVGLDYTKGAMSLAERRAQAEKSGLIRQEEFDALVKKAEITNREQVIKNIEDKFGFKIEGELRDKLLDPGVEDSAFFRNIGEIARNKGIKPSEVQRAVADQYTATEKRLEKFKTNLLAKTTIAETTDEARRTMIEKQQITSAVQTSTAKGAAASEQLSKNDINKLVEATNKQTDVLRAKEFGVNITMPPNKMGNLSQRAAQIAGW